MSLYGFTSQPIFDLTYGVYNANMVFSGYYNMKVDSGQCPDGQAHSTFLYSILRFDTYIIPQIEVKLLRNRYKTKD
jgi:hypothetical protein